MPRTSKIIIVPKPAPGSFNKHRPAGSLLLAQAAHLQKALIKHHAVAAVAIVPVPDARLGERACAVVVASGQPPTLSDLTEFLDYHGLAKFKFPERLLIVDELPINPGGKVDKNRLQALAADLVPPSH